VRWQDFEFGVQNSGVRINSTSEAKLKFNLFFKKYFVTTRGNSQLVPASCILHPASCILHPETPIR